jgi:hypothetical protein
MQRSKTTMCVPSLGRGSLEPRVALGGLICVFGGVGNKYVLAGNRLVLVCMRQMAYPRFLPTDPVHTLFR